MSIDENDVDILLCEGLPEFASAVREHRAEWPNEPMLYPLLGLLFDFVVREYNIAVGVRKEVSQRAYSIVERALTDGSKTVRDCFAIEMLEPLVGDTNHEFFPDLESVMGPASQRELHEMREWSKRKAALDEAMRQINLKLGIAMFSGIGQQDENNARAIADVDKWKQLRREDKESVYRALAQCWKSRIHSREVHDYRPARIGFHPPALNLAAPARDRAAVGLRMALGFAWPRCFASTGA